MMQRKNSYSSGLDVEALAILYNSLCLEHKKMILDMVVWRKGRG
jgi:hypothetical protein